MAAEIALQAGLARLVRAVASMRPRRMAAEIARSKAASARSAAASMRPRRMAAEIVGGREVGARGDDSASMRPRRMAAEIAHARGL